MANVVEEIRLILTEVGENKNKFWHGLLFDDGSVRTEWGRVGYNKQSKDFPGAGRTFLERKRREKEKKGYSEQRTVSTTPQAKVQNVRDSDLRSIARSQLVKTSNPVLDRLIDRLVQSNVHKITNSTQIQFNQDTGVFSTPLGVVTPDGITDARVLLANINGFISNRDYTSRLVQRAVSDYLRIIPQNVGMKLNIETLFPNLAAIQKQGDLLDSLESSYQAMQTAPAPKADTKAKPVEKVFEVDMDVCQDTRERRRLIDWYEKSKRSMHHYDRVMVKEVFSIKLHDMDRRFERNTKPIEEVWHGTSQANCLSILKSGLRVSPPSSAAIAGKMFGNGVYGAKVSSKSLGYTFGRWGQGGTGDSGWLFVCQFAMGKTKTVYNCCNQPRDHDSVWARSGQGLYNDELIVYRNNQVNITYLLECK